MNRIGWAALCAAGAVAMASEASADAYELTFNGVITSGQDVSGLFGLAAGANLAGFSAAETFQFDTSNIAFSTDGVSSFGHSTILTGAFVTVNGVQVNMLEQQTNSFFANQNFDPTVPAFYVISTEASVHTNSGGRAVDLESALIVFGHPILPSDFQLTDLPDLSQVSGSFNLSLLDRPCASVCGQPAGSIFESANGQIQFTGASARAIPEPATWALMISGFGMAGTALRRRRRTA